MTSSGILAMIEKMQMPFVYIYEGQRVGTNDQAAFATIDCVATPDELTPEIALKQVEEYFSYASPGIYTAKMKKQERSTNAMRKIKFSIEGAPELSSVSGIDSANIAKALEAKFEAQMADFKRQMEVERLKDEKKLLEQQLEASRGYEPKLNFLINGLAERYFMGNTSAPKAQVSGSQANTEDPENSGKEVERRVNDAVRNVAGKIQGDTAPLMESLAQLSPEELSSLAQLDTNVIRFALMELNKNKHEPANE